MNTKGIKFLAVLAVLAMAFAACAVIMTPADAGDAPSEERQAKGLKSSFVVTGAHGDMTVYLPDGAFALVSDKEATASPAFIELFGLTTNNTVLDSMDEAEWENWGATTGYAFLTINFKDLTGAAGKYIWIYQKSTALSVATTEQKDTMNVVSGTPYTERIKAYAFNTVFDGDDYANDLGVLIPQDGSSVVLDVFVSETAPKNKYADDLKIISEFKEADQVASITFATNLPNFVKDLKLDLPLVTVVDLDDLVAKEASYPYAEYTKVNSNYKDWTFDYKTKTLSGTFGSNVMFKGNDIKVGSGINDAMMTAAGFDIKLTQGGKASYFCSFQAALDAVTADATITLLDDCYSAESLAYTKAFALTVDLNGKELAIQADNNKDGKIGEGLFEIGNAQKAVKIANGTISVVPTILVPGPQKTLSVIENFNTNTELYNVHVEGEYIEADPAIGWDTVIFNRNGTLTLSGNTQICGEYATYAIVSDSFKHVHDDVAYTGSLVKIASSDVLVEGKMMVTYSTTSTAWGKDDLTGMGFSISAGKYTDVLSRGSITEFTNYTIGDYDVATYGDDMTFALSGGTYTDYSALMYVVKDKTINIDDGGKGVPAGPAKETDNTSGTVTIDPTALDANVANTLYMKDDTAVTKLEVDLGAKDLVLIGKDQALTGVKVTVTGTGTVAFYGFTSVTGEITTGTGSSAQTVKLDAAKGEFTVSQGSIVVNTDWEGGKILLRNGDVLKLSGNVLLNSSIEKDPADTSTSFSAKVIVEAGDVKALHIAAGKTLTVGAGIAFEIEGIVAGTEILEPGTLAVAKSITVKDGGILATKVTSATTNTVYSGGDINFADIDDITKWTGKDAASGTWTITKTGDGTTDATSYKYTLTLNNYKGTYNFAGIPDYNLDDDDPVPDVFYSGLVKIDLNGENVISVELPEILLGEITLFGGDALTNITTDGAGSLEINVDISEVGGEYLDDGIIVIDGGNLDINGVTLLINVSGSNPDWKAIETDKMRITGIKAYSLDFFDVPAGISIMPQYDSKKIYGIDTGALGITGKTMLIEAATAIDAGITTIKTAAVGVNGDAYFAGLTISNISDLEVNGLLEVFDVEVSQESKIGIKDAVIYGDMSNKGIVKIAGNVMIEGDVVNYAEMENNGFIGVYGSFTNDVSASTAPGVFTNNGTLEVFAFDLDAVAAEVAITDAAVTANNAKLKSITIGSLLDPVEMQYNGNAKFIATIDVYKSEGYSTSSDVFEGTITPVNDGYILTMSSKTATVTIVYDSTATGGAYAGKQYTINVTGTVKVGDDSLYLQPSTTTSGSAAEITVDSVADGLFAASGADFDVKAGTVNNENGTIIVASSVAEEDPAVATDVIIYADATFNGNLVTTINDVTVKGTFNGNLTASGKGTATVANFNGDVLSMGKVEVAKDKTMIGNIFAKKDVTITGSLVGNITAEGNVDIAKMIGKVTVDRSTKNTDPLTVTVRDASMISLVYNSLYKATKDATEPTMYTATMTVSGTPSGLVIDLAKGSDATAATEVVPGYFGIKETAELKENKTVDMTLTEGRLLVDTPVVLEARHYLIIEAGATIEVNKSAASLDVKKAALKVSKDANALFEVGSGTPVNYGKVLFVMAFEIDDGAYTIYSDVAYALLNCNENTELVVGESAEINQDVTVKAGVNIVVEDVTLTFTGKDVEMSEGAKITLEGTGKVIFKETGDNKTDTKKGDAITYYSVSGTIVYEDNAVVFDEVRFTADSTIQGVAATSTAVDKIKTDLAFDEGTAKLASGVGTGTITLNNDVNNVTNDDEPETVMVFATFVVGADTVFDAVAINDSAGKVLYKDYKDEDEPEVKEYTLLATIVGVEGTLNLSADTTINGAYIGTGKVVIADGKKVTLASGQAPAPKAEKFVPGSLNTYFVDSTEDANGYLFNLTTTDAGTATPLTLTAGTITVSGEKVNVMKIKGCLYVGIVKATTAACLDDLYVHEHAAIYGAVVYVIDDSNADGYVGAGLIFMDESPFKALDYEVTFEEDGYTIYTQFDTVEWTDATDITIVKGEIEIKEKLDLSGKDVNIVIGEKATFTLKNILIIGTPATVIGDEGSSIVGKITIIEDAKAYLVAYADVDLTEAEIYGNDGKTDAVFSKLDIEDVVYAAIFASNQDDDNPLKHAILAKADAAIIPAIVGYNFTSWLNYNGDAKAEVGETNAYADARAVYLTVTVKYVAGVDYYMNGSLFNVYDIPTDVPYGSYFTAKISDTTKYQGNPLINGEKTVCVLDDMELVASGVTPIPEPTPEPVEENTGLSLTDILLIVLVILIAIMVVILVLRLNRS